MIPLRKLAAQGFLAMAVVTLPVAAAVYLYFGATSAGAFAYGVGVGVVVFTAIALTVSLITGPTSSGRMLLGAIVYVGRLGFAALAIGLPVALAGWSIAWIFVGFAVVYAVENVTVLVVLGKSGSSVAEWRSEIRERRIEA